MGADAAHLRVAARVASISSICVFRCRCVSCRSRSAAYSASARPGLVNVYYTGCHGRRVDGIGRCSDPLGPGGPTSDAPLGRLSEPLGSITFRARICCTFISSRALCLEWLAITVDSIGNFSGLVDNVNRLFVESDPQGRRRDSEQVSVSVGVVEEAEPHSIEIGIWVVVLGELTLFTIFFTTFLYYRGQSPEVFEISRASLRTDLGALNTVLLITSSWFVAVAARKLRVGEHSIGSRYFAGALICGVSFVVVKIAEYGGAYHSGVNVLTDDFYMFYFMLTGIHLLHVFVGITLLGSTIAHINGSVAYNRPISSALVDFASSFWHMLDLVWIVLFPLLYLLR